MEQTVKIHFANSGTGQISPEQGKLGQPNFHCWLSPRCRFINSEEIPDLAGYVDGGGPRISSIPQKSKFRGLNSQFFQPQRSNS